MSIVCFASPLQSLLKDEEQHRWFIDMGRDLIGGLLAKAEKVQD